MSYIRDNSFVWKEIDGESFILDIQNEKSHALNESASLIWNSLETQKTTEDLCSLFMQEFDVSQDVAAQDIQNTLDELIKLRLIKTK